MKLNKKYLPVVIVVGAVLVTAALKITASEPKRRGGGVKSAYVEVIIAEPADITAKVQATGLVEAARRVSVIPEVGGKLVSIADELVPGTRVSEGMELARIDPRPYRLALKQDKSRVRQAELEFQIESGRADIAAREWDMLNEGGDAGESALALRRPELEVVRTNLEAARGALSLARLNLERTIIAAPFNAIVLDKHADVGQLVGPGTPVATLLGTDGLWVSASIPVEKLNSIEVPGINTEGEGSGVVAIQNLSAGRKITRTGNVLRLEGALDPQTRTAKLLINIDSPFDVPTGGLPLLPGAFVDIEIEGAPMSGVFELPRSSLHGGGYVWAVGPDSKLVKKELEIAWKSREKVMVVAGLNPGDKIVTSPMAAAMEGMAVEIVDQ